MLHLPLRALLSSRPHISPCTLPERPVVVPVINTRALTSMQGASTPLTQFLSRWGGWGSPHANQLIHPTPVNKFTPHLSTNPPFL
jgi:hypothetical protein